MVLYVRREKLGDISYIDSFVGLILPKDIKPNKNFKILDNRGPNLLSSPLTVTINITNLCNFSCGFCYFKKGKDSLTYKQIDLLLKYIKQNYIYEVDILGGEPLFPKVATKTKYLIKKLLKLNSVKKIYLSTNGYFLNKEFYELLSNTKIELSISLEGIEKDHNLLTKTKSFSKVVTNILNIDKKTNIKYTITTVINKLNKDNLEKFYNNFLTKLTNLKCWLWHYPTVVSYNKNFLNNVISLEDFYVLVAEFRQKLPILILVDAPYNYLFSNSKLPESPLEKVLCMCKAKYKKIEVMPNGDVFPCVLLQFNEYKLGSLENGFKYDPDKIILNNSCKNKECKYYPICYGCLGYKLANGVDNRCPRYK